MAPIKEWFGAYNVIYAWFEEKYGCRALEEYWEYIADKCFDDVAEKFRSDGLPGIKTYFESIFATDQGECISELTEDRLVVNIEKCPDYEFMTSSGNPWFKPNLNYCRHHQVINSKICRKSGYSFSLDECDYNGKCKWTFRKATRKEEG